MSEPERTRQSQARRSRLTDVVCVVGLGYVGLPLAYEFDRIGHDVVGFDIDDGRIEQLRRGIDPTGDVGDAEIADSSIAFTTDEAAIGEADFVLVAVPTPVDEMKNPNLDYVQSAGKTIGRHIEAGTTVVLESTVYPGATREIFAPAVEEASGLTYGEEFFVGYSPERMVPGDEEHGLRNVVKIVSGQNEETLEEVASLYEGIVDAGVHRAPAIEVAEMAKVVENTQRDLNIALVNELAIAAENLGVDGRAVLEAAGTKWNFHDYRPGLVGGHCIPVDPFFMVYQSERNGYSPKLVQQAREVNEYMPKHVGELALKAMNDCGQVPKESTVLVLGLAYKPGVGDVRTSAVDGTIDYLEEYGVDVVGFDPHADDDVMREEFGIEILEQLTFEDVDGIVLATPHDRFLGIDYKSAAIEMDERPFFLDVDAAMDETELTEYGFEYRRI
ncbi:nucleotide sugar dehydrogenase [Natronobeatus ordinarius]|uniref:nucleotide sugar dehydrogenase n=1 Tax=Natronobeatus ordinarius TaxID=2963433 RepID=UPI0020CC99FD|nr:nucleotide sugar dehydrogenase [Natronobeatus ordinarius]